MMAGLVPMATSGAVTSVLAPALILLTPRIGLPWNWDRLALPAPAALPLFAVGHAAIMITMATRQVPAPLAMVAHALLLLGAIVFWLPVLGRRCRLSDPGRTAYLLLAVPTLDLAAVWIIATGDSTGGLAMIVAMLPIGVAAVVITWRWMVREERLADERMGVRR